MKNFFAFFFVHWLRSWWVILFGLICLGVYERTMQTRAMQYHSLQEQLKDLQQKVFKASKLNQELSLRIQSQNEPSGIELTLMQELGVVPENQRKIFFKKRD